LLLLAFTSNDADLVAVDFNVVVAVVVATGVAGAVTAAAAFTFAATAGFTSASGVDVVVVVEEELELEAPSNDDAPLPAVERAAATRAPPIVALLPTIVICTSALMTCSLGCVSK